MGRLFKRQIMQLIGILLAALFYNEFLVYYLVLFRCTWPTQLGSSGHTLKAMFIADTHLLGPTGHWWDRLRREWQMQRTFQTSLLLHEPDVVFILGDLFDDGKWSRDAAFQQDVSRFHKMFAHSPSVQLVSVIGNHDVGFHYMIDGHKRKRFVEAVNSSDSVTFIRHKGISFVTVNSMAMEGDNCNMCSQARKDLADITRRLSCAENSWPDTAECNKYTDKHEYTTPILLQHFPMYRESDANCTGPDSTPHHIKYDKFREKYDCLSQQASNQLMRWVKPRLIISGHTHYFCLRTHENGVEEWSVPSFSWRNNKGSSFLMAQISRGDYSINKCYMPNENTVYLVYFIVISVVAVYAIVQAASYLVNQLRYVRTKRKQ